MNRQKLEHDELCKRCEKIARINLDYSFRREPEKGFSDALKEVEKEIDNLKRKNPKGVPWISAPELKQRLEKLRGGK